MIRIRSLSKRHLSFFLLAFHHHHTKSLFSLLCFWWFQNFKLNIHTYTDWERKESWNQSQIITLVLFIFSRVVCCSLLWCSCRVLLFFYFFNMIYAWYWMIFSHFFLFAMPVLKQTIMLSVYHPRVWLCDRLGELRLFAQIIFYKKTFH